MIVSFLLVLAYTIVSGIVFGLALSGFVYRTRLRRPDVSPAWEVMQGLLLAGFVVAILWYPPALPTAIVRLQPLWPLIVMLLLIRFGLVVIDYAGGYRWRSVRWSLALVSIVLPAVLVQNVTVLIAGDPNLGEHVGAGIAMALVAIVMTVALWSGWHYRPGRAVREVARTSFWFGLVMVAVALPLALSLDGDIASERTILTAWWPVYVAAAGAVGCLTFPVRWRYFAASSVLVSGLGIALLGLVRVGL